ncbi:MAG: hypothetical protein E7556_03855 [Ruminococcaceae bacterium]|nr:hypothetical protein [Oscillospiraceae bacterium]
MTENYELVQKGFRILLSSLSGFIGQKMCLEYKNNWWEQVLGVLDDQRDLPYYGEYNELIDSLDIANCIRIIDRQWTNVFRNHLSQNCRSWAKELMGIRNMVAHIGQSDLDQPLAERALNTMYLLCKECDEEAAEEINEIYKEARSRASDISLNPVTKTFTGLAQPASDSNRDEAPAESLLNYVGTDLVQKTDLTRKITYNGKTVIYPVYRVNLELLYYNDQNDRIATWISAYESENGKDSLKELNSAIYNRIIENFITESNPDSIQKTRKNISLVGQREPGVTLSDGRIVDGNRRFTCLRINSRETTEPLYFETVIMEMDIIADKKTIKLLELAIQHGEEKKVDYDAIDHTIGTYRDIVKTNLLTIEEYAETSNESVANVKKRIEIAGLINEFLEYLSIPEQYHIARKYQVHDLFREMLPLFNSLSDENEKNQMKVIAFNNTLIGAVPDQRKFMRDIKALVRSGNYKNYFDEQSVIAQEISKKYASIGNKTKEALDSFAEENSALAERMRFSMEKALLSLRAQELKARPVENIASCISLLLDIDSRLFVKLDPDEKSTLNAELSNLIETAENLKKLL